MFGCHDCQDRMLEHLYDLLEGDEARAFSDHLAGCAACQAALERARGQQHRLARAARASFPDVRFAAPPVEPALPLRRPARRWARWALAASVLLALGALALPAARLRRDYVEARDTVRQAEQAIAEGNRQAGEAGRGLELAALERDEKLNALERDRRARGLRLVVSGPRNVQPGAPADFQVQTVDFNGQPADAELAARLTDEAAPKALTFAAEAATQAPNNDLALSVQRVDTGLYSVRVPPSVKHRPGRSLSLQVAARRKDDKATREPVALHGVVRLTAPVYLTHLTTDKPLYQPGETVRFRSLTLDRLGLTPPAEDLRLRYKITNPDGSEQLFLRGPSALMTALGNVVNTVNGPDGKPLRGVGAGELPLGAEAPGGEYTLTVFEEQNRFAPVTRKFVLNRYQKPRLDKKLDFNRSSYGPGDEVQVRASARRADGGPARNVPVEAAVTIDDSRYDAAGQRTGDVIRATTDDAGEVTLRFKLPASIERGQASLGLTFRDGGNTETIVRPIPIVLKKLNVEFFPEGGDLVAGLVNRVYFQARTTLGKPAQMTGTILEDGTALADVKVATLHDDAQPGVNQGMGAFTFTPKAGKKYALRIDTPTGVTEMKPLPEVRPDGVVMRVEQGVLATGEAIKVRVSSTRARAFLIGAYCRGQVLATAQLAAGQSEAELKPIGGAGGVVRVTVFEERPAARGGQGLLRPVAERLIYRAPRERVDIALSPDQRRYTPGQKVNLSLLAVDEKEKFVPAVVMLSVVDRSVLTLADEKTARTMPTHFLMTTEVRRADELEHADFLLTGHPRAGEALDLLLGTQGWRRFAEQKPQELRDRIRREGKDLPQAEQQRQEADAERLLVMIGQSSQMSTDVDQENARAVAAAFQEKHDRLARQQAEARAAANEARGQEEYAAAVAALGRHNDRMRLLRTRGLPALGALLMVVGLGGLIVSRARQVKLALGGVAAAGGVALVLALVGPFGAAPGLTALDRSASMAAAGEEAARGQLRPEAAAADGRGDWRDLDADAPGDDNAGRRVGPQGMGLIEAEAERNAEEARDQPKAGLARPMAPGAKMAPPGRFRGAFGPGAPGGVPPGAMPPGEGGRPGAAGDARRDEVAFKRMADREAGGADFALRRQLASRLRGNEPAGAGKGGGEADRMRGFAGGGFGRGGRGPGDAYMYEPPLLVREFAHVNTTPPDGVRSDFTETIYWHPVLVLPQDGKATVSFALSDSVTSFQATAFAHTLDGRLGASTRLIESRLPLTLAPKVPLEVTATDRIDIPVAVTNNTPDARTISLALSKTEGLDLLAGDRQLTLDLKGDAQARRLYSFRPSLVQGTAKLELEGRTGPFRDAIRETMRVVPDGFPVEGSSSDVLERSATHKIKLPRWMPGTLAVRVDVYPSTLADLQKGLEGLIREPSGCFEQSSSSNYPNVLILDYLRISDKSSPEAERRIRDVLDRGYQKLTGFECQQPGASTRRGYEWFGGTAPPHEALTAYGLLQFQDMARVHDVNKDMVARTRKYLLDQRDGNGGFKRNPRALDTFGRAPEHVTNAYIVWALTEAGGDDVTKELDALAKKAKESKDPYFLSLVALALTNRDRRAEAQAIMKAVAKLQKEDGRLEATDTSITGSGGRDLTIETTALATLAWLKLDALGSAAQVRLTVKWLGQQRGGHGAFGSTQATILALKALIAHAAANKRTVSAGEVRLFVGEQQVGREAFGAGHDKPITIGVPDAEKLLVVGENKLRVEITGDKNVFPHTLSWTCRTEQPDSAKGAPVELTTSLAKASVKEGETVRLSVKVKNASGKPQGMAVAIVGLPAGMILPEDLKQLKEYCKLPEDGRRPLVSFFEVRGRELVLYWRDMGVGQEISVPVDVIARVPGSYRGPASRAYLYYNADTKHWVAPLAATIAAR